MSDEQHQQKDGTAQPEGSVALAIARYQQGDDSELGEMMFAYCARLLVLARAKLEAKAPNLRSKTDPEEAVSSAMRSYWRGVKAGKDRDMKHRNDLLGLLTTIVYRKVAHQIRDLATESAGGGKVQNEPQAGLDAGRRLAALSQGSEPSPMDAAIGEELLRQWRDYMTEKGFLDVAEMVLEGHSYREIAGRLEITEAKARRSITIVRVLTKEVFGLEENAEE